MRKCFLAERFLLFRSRNKSSHFHFSQRWIASTKAALGNDDDLLDLLDQAGQDISIGTDAHRQKPRDVAKPYLDESAQELRSSMPDLPLSPLMDPKLVSARKSYRTPKPQPTGPASALEKKLSKSPYAQALSTPLRHCRLTDSRLPSHFLLSFGITKHPITGVQWHSPRIAVDPLLMSKEDEAPAESSLEHENADETPEVQPTVDVSPPNEKPSEDVSLVNQSAEIKNLDESPQNEPSEKLPSDSLTVKDTELKAKVSSPMPGTRKAASSYFICSQPAMKVLSGFSQRSWMNAIPHTWKSDSGIRADKLVWRKDMDGFVLELLRKKTFALLKMLASSRTGYITSCAGYNSVGAHNQVAAALWLGASTPANITGSQELLASSGACTSQEEVAGDLLSPGAAAPLQETTSAGHNSTPQAEIASSEGLDPPSYAMIKYKSHYIPFYNLPMLLGSEYISRLRAYIPFAQGTMALIKNKQRTVKAQMELWKLMGYMAQTEILEALESKVQSGDRKEGRKGEDGKGNSGKEKIGKGEGETGESEKAKDEKDAGREAKERISKTLTKTKTETVKKKPKEEKASPSKEKRSEKRSEK